MIINYEKLEKPIRDLEEILNDYDLEEQQLILRYINQRIMSNVQLRQSKQLARETISGLSIKDMMKSFTKKKE